MHVSYNLIKIEVISDTTTKFFNIFSEMLFSSKFMHYVLFSVHTAADIEISPGEIESVSMKSGLHQSVNVLFCLICITCRLTH